MADIKFVDGMIAKKPHERAPEFIKATLAIRVEELIAWLQAQEHNGWLAVDIKESKNGKWYAQLNEFKPLGMTEKPEGLRDVKDDINPEDVPF